MRGPSAQSREDERARKQNGGRGSPGNTLDRRQKGESPLGIPWDGGEKKRKKVE